MMNILLSTYNFTYNKHRLINYIVPGQTVTIVPLSHTEQYYKHEYLFNNLYDYSEGTDLNYLALQFREFGIPKYAISIINPFTDDKEEMINKINDADILFFTGGNPKDFMIRAKKYDILDTLREYRGIVMGASAGAMVQVKEFMLYPCDECDEFEFIEGLGYIDDCYDVMVHYNVNNEEQDRAIEYSIEKRPNIKIIAISDFDIYIYRRDIN